MGLALEGCASLGPVCLGTAARMKRDVDARLDRTDWLRARAAIDLLVTAEIPWAIGPAILRPGLEAGLGWVHMRLENKVASRETEDDEVNRGGLRAGAHLAAGIALAGRWSLQVATGAGVSLFAHTRSFVVGDVSVPGEPRTFLRAAVGVRYGGP
jgi:hypothetical protein